MIQGRRASSSTGVQLHEHVLGEWPERDAGMRAIPASADNVPLLAACWLRAGDPAAPG